MVVSNFLCNFASDLKNKQHTTMKTKEEIRAFIEALQWNRCTKKDLLKKFNDFFGTQQTEFEDSTDSDFKEVDYSLIYTNESGHGMDFLVDIEIFYLNMRQRNWILISGCEILTYDKNPCR